MAKRRRGYFIVLDGPDGSGKSTQVALLAARLKQEGIEVTRVRDPGGTMVSERVRDLLLDPALGEIDSRTEMFLYMASRAEMVARVVRPALANGLSIVSDRFISSTVAYQGYAGGLDPKQILRVGKIACGDTWPDLVIILDVPAKVGFERIRRAHDRMELKGLAYHERVVAGYRKAAAVDPKRHVLVDGRGSIETVAGRVWKAVQRALL
jgi:dTMP kinase